MRNSIVHAASSKNRWSLLSKLLHKNLPPPTSVSEQEYHNYIVSKVELIRSNTSLISKINNDNAIKNNYNNNDNFVDFSSITLSDLTSIYILLSWYHSYIFN